jgi:uncharacterized coiled-coil protein SlyX
LQDLEVENKLQENRIAHLDHALAAKDKTLHKYRDEVSGDWPLSPAVR